MAKSTRYRFVGSHADTLANGRPVEPGEFVDLTDDEVSDPFNQGFINDDLLVAIGSEKSGSKGEES